MQNIHAGHRERLKNKFLRFGAEALEEHELLELLLFYAIPQKDTNPIAHNLINRFGSVAGVLKAEPKELTEVSGIGMHAATLLKLQAALAKVYYTSVPQRPRLSNMKEAADFIVKQLFEYKSEVFYAFALDINLGLLGYKQIAEGDIDMVPVELKKLASFALDMNAAFLILAHNHPNGSVLPSRADIHLTRQIVSGMSPLGIGVCDHIITSGKNFYSFHQHRQFCMEQDEQVLYAAQYSAVFSSDKEKGTTD